MTLHPSLWTEVILAVAYTTEAGATLYYRRRARRAEASLLRWAGEIVKTRRTR